MRSKTEILEELHHVVNAKKSATGEDAKSLHEQWWKLRYEYIHARIHEMLPKTQFSLAAISDIRDTAIAFGKANIERRDWISYRAAVRRKEKLTMDQFSNLVGCIYQCDREVPI